MIEEAIINGSRHDIACNDVGINIKTLKRWKVDLEDKRKGPLTAPANKLTLVEIQEIVKVSTTTRVLPAYDLKIFIINKLILNQSQPRLFLFHSIS